MRGSFLPYPRPRIPAYKVEESSKDESDTRKKESKIALHSQHILVGLGEDLGRHREHQQTHHEGVCHVDKGITDREASDDEVTFWKSFRFGNLGFSGKLVRREGAYEQEYCIRQHVGQKRKQLNSHESIVALMLKCHFYLECLELVGGFTNSEEHVTVEEHVGENHGVAGVGEIVLRVDTE